MAPQMLESGADDNARVRTAEVEARCADMARGDFMIFQFALTSLEKYLHDFCRILNLDPVVKESFGALFMEQRKECEVTKLLYDNIVSRYDRFLNLVPYLHSYFNGCLAKNITAAELHQSPDSRRGEESLRAKCGGWQEDGRSHRIESTANSAERVPGTIHG